MPPHNLGWSYAVPWAESSTNDVLRLPTPEEHWELSLAPPRVTSAHVERPRRGGASLDAESSRVTPHRRPAENHPAELQPIYRTVKNNTAGIKISVSGLTFQGKGETQSGLAHIFYVVSSASNSLRHRRLHHHQIQEHHPAALL